MKNAGEIHAETIAQLRAGDEAAFRLIFDHYHRRLYLFSYKFLKSKEQSEEVVQDTFVSLWNNRETLQTDVPISALLFTIAKRLTLNFLRNASKHRAIQENLWKAITDSHNETEESVIVADLKDYSEKVVCKLPKQQQLVFKLSRYEHLSYDEIGQKLGISPNTVKNHLVQALKNLRFHFSDSEYLVFLVILNIL